MCTLETVYIVSKRHQVYLNGTWKKNIAHWFTTHPHTHLYLSLSAFVSSRAFTRPICYVYEKENQKRKWMYVISLISMSTFFFRFWLSLSLICIPHIFASHFLIARAFSFHINLMILLCYKICARICMMWYDICISYIVQQNPN